MRSDAESSTEYLAVFIMAIVLLIYPVAFEIYYYLKG